MQTFNTGDRPEGGRRQLVRHQLSKLIPMRFTSTYQEEVTAWTDGQVVRRHHVRSTWWQWRGRIWAHHRAALP